MLSIANCQVPTYIFRRPSKQRTLATVRRWNSYGELEGAWPASPKREPPSPSNCPWNYRSEGTLSFSNTRSAAVTRYCFFLLKCLGARGFVLVGHKNYTSKHAARQPACKLKHTLSFLWSILNISAKMSSKSILIIWAIPFQSWCVVLDTVYKFSWFSVQI